MLENTVAVLIHCFLDEIIYDITYQFGVVIDANHVSVCNHQLLKLLFFQLVVIVDLVNLAELSNCLEEFVCRAGFLWLEE